MLTKGPGLITSPRTKTSWFTPCLKGAARPCQQKYVIDLISLLNWAKQRAKNHVYSHTSPFRTKQCHIKAYPSTSMFTLIKRDETRQYSACRSLMNITGEWWHRQESRKNELAWWKSGRNIKDCKNVCAGAKVQFPGQARQFYYIPPALTFPLSTLMGY